MLEDSNSDWVIETKNLSKMYGPHLALDGLNLQIPRGAVGVLGPNGAGKSTLFKCILGLIQITSGSGQVLGFDIQKEGEKIRSKIGYMPEYDALDPGLSAIDQVRYAGEILGMNTDVATQRAHEVLEYVGLKDQRYRKIDTFSTGMKQATKLACALIHDPEILIMDHPTAFMDAESYRHCWDLLLRFRGEKTILYVSQTLQEVEAAHDRILVLEDGRIALDGSLDKLLGSTFEFHQFQIEFEELSEDLFQKLSKLPKVKNPSRIGNSIHFYGRERNVFFEVLNAATSAIMNDISVKKLGLQDLMDAKFAKDGIH